MAVGKKIFRFGCAATFTLKTCSLTITYKQASCRSHGFAMDSGSGDTETLQIDLEEALEVKFFVNKQNGDADEGAADDLNVTSFLAIGVAPNDGNGLSRFPNVYQPSGDDLLRKYIVMEFRSEKELEAMHALMLEHQTLCVYLTEDSKLNAHEAKGYCQALQADSDKEEGRRGGSSVSASMSTFLVGKGPNDTLFVYPFDADAADIDRAAEGLTELSAPAADATAAVAEEGEEE